MLRVKICLCFDLHCLLSSNTSQSVRSFAKKYLKKKKNESAVLHNALHMPFLELARETFWLSKCEIESKHAMRH